MDTLVASRLILPHVEDLDDQAGAMGDAPLGKLRGRYSIEAWGARLGIPKVGIDIKDWSEWSPEMEERCAGDTAICKAVWQFLRPDGYSRLALELEHRAATICERITADGVPFDLGAAAELCQLWTARRAELSAQLRQRFPDVNLNSRKQLGVLLEARGWVPEKRTEKTRQPMIDDELLETLPALYPEFAGLAEYAVLGRRLAQLSAGKQAWSKHVVPTAAFTAAWFTSARHTAVQNIWRRTWRKSRMRRRASRSRPNAGHYFGHRRAGYSSPPIRQRCRTAALLTISRSLTAVPTPGLSQWRRPALEDRGRVGPRCRRHRA